MEILITVAVLVVGANAGAFLYGFAEAAIADLCGKQEN